MVQFDLPYGAPYETAPGQIIDPSVYASFGDVDPVWGNRAAQVKVNGSTTVSYQSIFLLTNFTSDGMGGYVYGSPHTTALTIEAAAVEFSPTPYPGLPVFYTIGTS
jgi:hypothetical protein